MNEQELIANLNELKISVNETQITQLEKYYELLIAWNEKINLTSITDKNQVYLKHFYDSATLSKIIDLNEVDTFCDVGTGAGFPGIVIKILFPHLKVTLVDALNKRINFLSEVVDELALKDVTLVHERIEDYARNNREKFDLVTARAVANLPVLLEYTIPLVKENKYFVAMKGIVAEEVKESANAIKVLNITLEQELSFLLPFENSTRTLLSFKKLAKTNHKYPRKYSEIKKRPL